MRYLFFVVLLIAISFSNAQAQGNKLCVHKVVSGETLYAISLKYKTNVKKLEFLNDGLTPNLSLGQEIKVPCLDNAQAETNKPAKPKEGLIKAKAKDAVDEFKGNYIFHTIVAKETVYSLTKKYKITEAQLLKDNEEVKRNGLKVGDVIRILQKEDTAEDEKVVERYFLKIAGDGNLNSFGADSSLFKDSTVFQLAVMLPFQYERNVEHLKNFNDDQKPSLYRETKTFVELYQGVLMAVDSISKLGLDVQLFVYDTKADTNEIKKILGKPEAKYFDLVIGPGYTSTFLFASKYLKHAGIPMISPLSKKDKILENNPYVIKITPSEFNHFEAITKYINKNYLNANIIIAMQDDNDKPSALKIQRDIMAQALMADSSATLIPHIVKGDYGVHGKLQNGKKNIVILANNKEAFASRLTTKLVNKSSKFDIMVFGSEKLKKYKNIEVAYWDSLNIHVTSASEIKYGYPQADQFVKGYFEKYYSEPSKFAFMGYDMTFLILKQTLREKKYKHSYLVGNYFIGGYRDYEFKYNGDQNGISNKSIHVYRFHDFKFIRVDD